MRATTPTAAPTMTKGARLCVWRTGGVPPVSPVAPGDGEGDGEGEGDDDGVGAADGDAAGAAEGVDAVAGAVAGVDEAAVAAGEAAAVAAGVAAAAAPVPSGGGTAGSGLPNHRTPSPSALVAANSSLETVPHALGEYSPLGV